jgi:hypothetical protein
MKKFVLFFVTVLGFSFFTSSFSYSKTIKFRGKVTIKVGQSIVLKGVRSRNCGDQAEKWADLVSRLPKSKLGTFSDGGEGTVNSNFCGGIVGGRGIRFTATKKGKERLKIYGDFIRINVR